MWHKKLLSLLKKGNDANLVVTIDSPSPGFEEICGKIQKSLELEVFEVEPFFDYDRFIGLKRFSSMEEWLKNMFFKRILKADCLRPAKLV
jgi:hypothetical protein